MFPESDPRFYIEPPTAQAQVEYISFFAADSIQLRLPTEKRLPLSEIAAPLLKRAFGVEPGQPIGAFVYEGANQLEPIDPEKRVAWLRKVGISYQTIVPTKGYVLMRWVEDPKLGMEAIAHLNTYLSDRLKGYTNRLNLVTSLRYEDIDWCVKELTRMRDRGSRTFFMPGEPVNLIPPYDPYYDPVWGAASDLGMIGLLHIGAAHPYLHPGWGNTRDPMIMAQMASCGLYFNAHIMMNAMVLGGVFDRFPNFTMQISEYGLEWLPYTVANMDKRALQSGGFSGEYQFPLMPSEYVRRNVRISGLPGQDPRHVLEMAPETVAFASDFPHMEGTPNPVEHFLPYLEGFSDATRLGYFGGNILEAYMRMGDPLSVDG